jgi:NAD(P)-dependent dehydrogenase (short-subunit alcohol dehydrogenase family)
MKRYSLVCKVVLITGGGRGLGAATATAHVSQSDAAALLQVLSAAGDLAEVGGRVEEYVRVYPPVVGPLPTVEHDFFESVGR